MQQVINHQIILPDQFLQPGMCKDVHNMENSVNMPYIHH